MSAKKKNQELAVNKTPNELLDDIRSRLEKMPYHNESEFNQAKALWESALEMFMMMKDIEQRWISVNEQLMISEYQRSVLEQTTQQAKAEALEWGKRDLGQLMAYQLDIPVTSMKRFMDFFGGQFLADVPPWYLNQLRDAIKDMDESLLSEMSAYGDDESLEDDEETF